jgi:hypothetical protein
MASWADLVIADVKSNFAADEAKDILNPHWQQWSGANFIRIATPEYHKWLFKTDKRRTVALKDSVRDFKNRRTEYTKMIHDMLGGIFFYDAGSALLHDILDSGKILWIRPYTIYGTSDVPNAETVPISKAGEISDIEAATEATAVGMPIFNDGVVLDGSGLGLGTDTIIQFSPMVFSPQEQNLEGPGSEPDEVLFHEMVHASRMMHGVSYSIPVNQGYTDEEEYLGVVLTNVYLSEKRKTAFRGGQKAGSPSLKQPDKFLDNVQGTDMAPIVLIERFRLRSPKLYDAFAKIGEESASFNPIRDFEKRRKDGKIRFN